MRLRWGDTETAAEKTQRRRLEWLGHLATCLTTEYPNPLCLAGCPNHALAVGQGKMEGCNSERHQRYWNEQEQVVHRSRAMCSLDIGRNTVAQTLQRDNAQEVECDVCSRKFRRESDMKRHKCLDEQSIPLCEQKGAQM